ncbi:MAG: DinB family protein [Anaerolineales bacterium]
MLTAKTLSFLYDYHYWMNARILHACEALTPEQWDQPLGHSWGSVHGVLAHMLGAEVIWLARWQGHSPTALLKVETVPALADVADEWARVEADVRVCIAGCDEVRLADDFSWTDTRGHPHRAPLGPVMLHVANHGTHHRGELVAMLALLDVPHPEDDLLWYIYEQRDAGKL